MKISTEDVRHISRLARLNITDEETEVMRGQLDSILTYVDKLGELDTKDVSPMSHVIPLQNVLREDVDKESLPREKALANAPEKSDGCYRVPKIIE
ncbi:MAG: Asp-tRNA(Asn)/Glu-tRNA(Gln) amidotransferase subunit GatC [Nitrospirota bacterium]|nr:Asp-tRNA(Asn)/Glu-tRNA(Gln) amidotransferase subunit GatC [Nitrospirota bacterium]